MGFQPGHKLSTGRPKGSVRKKGVKQMAEALAKSGFDIAEEVMKLLEDKNLDPKTRLQTLQFIAQYTQGAYKEPEQSDEDSSPLDEDSDDLVAKLKRV